MAPGILYVTIQPKPSLTVPNFEDWYNNEHGPNRLRLSFCTNGFRYRASDGQQHEWMAVYDLTDTSLLESDEYLALRGPPVQTKRETDLRPHLDINRRTFDLLREWKTDDYRPLERLGGEDSGAVISAITFTLHAGADPGELDRWYEQEHVAMLQRVRGWRRTRRFRTSPVDGQREETEYLALHEFAPDNGLGGEALKAAVVTPWSRSVMGELAKSMERRRWAHHYTLGPAPRHLSTVADWTSPATRTRTVPAASGTPYNAVESYVTTADGAVLPYRLEGSSSAVAPVVLCINSILTHPAIWDSFVTGFLLRNPNYRVLRYQSRGRSSSYGKEEPITVETLTKDALALLDALRIQSPALCVGVSLGGATTLSLGLYHADRVGVWLACDTNSKAPPGNPKAWGERIAMAEADSSNTATTQSPYGGAVPDSFVATVAHGGRIVGEQLADATVKRWFVPESFDGGSLEARVNGVHDMVRTNSLDGFKASVRALYEYDFTADMASCKSRGGFLVGGGDGSLPDGMRKMAEALGDGKGGTGVALTVVPGAGHLPMVEKPADVVAVVEAMLSSNT